LSILCVFWSMGIMWSALSMLHINLLWPSVISTILFPSFQFLFSIFTIFAMWRVEISSTSCWSNHTCNRTWHLHKQVYTFFQVLFLHVQNFKLHWSTCYSWGKYQVSDQFHGPTFLWYHALRFLEFYEELCLLEFCGWHCDSSGKDIQKNLKCDKRSVDLYRAGWTVGLIWSE